MALNIDQRLNGLNPLAYLGDNAVQPPDFITKNRPPTLNDSKNVALGDIWLNLAGYPNILPTAENIYMLVALVGNQATWVNLAGGNALETLTGNSGGSVPGDANDNINILGSGVISVIGTPGTNTLIITPSGSIASSFITAPTTATATPSNGVMTFAGASGLTASAGGSTVTFSASGTISQSFPTDSGTATPVASVLNMLGGTAGRDINTSGSGNTIHVDLKNAITLGDLSAIGTGANALRATTGDITISTGNINVGPSNAAGTRGYYTVENFGAPGTQVSVFGFPGNNLVLGGNASAPSLVVNTAVGNILIGGGYGTITTGFDNTILSAGGAIALTSGSQNCIVGPAHTAVNLTTGLRNLLLGIGAGNSFTNAESDNILLVNSGTLGESGSIRIGTSGTHVRNFQSGIRGVTTTAADAIPVLISSTGQLGTISSSVRFKENIETMSSESMCLFKFRPVTFDYKNHSSMFKSVGLIAEEVEKLAPSLVVHDEFGMPESVKYHDLPVLLLNELQKMKQELINNDLIITELTRRIELLESLS